MPGELLIARCEALLAAGDVASAVGAVSQLQQRCRRFRRVWRHGRACFDGELSMLIRSGATGRDRESRSVTAAAKLAELDDAAGEAKAHTVRAGCLARLGRIGDCEIALDDALTAARRARDHRRVNAVLAGAPLAALWGPNPVPRAGGRCLDVVRLLRITTDSPRSRRPRRDARPCWRRSVAAPPPGRRMIDSARRHGHRTRHAPRAAGGRAVRRHRRTGRRRARRGRAASASGLQRLSSDGSRRRHRRDRRAVGPRLSGARAEMPRPTNYARRASVSPGTR